MGAGESRRAPGLTSCVELEGLQIGIENQKRRILFYILEVSRAPESELGTEKKTDCVFEFQEDRAPKLQLAPRASKGLASTLPADVSLFIDSRPWKRIQTRESYHIWYTLKSRV